jgi:hypothetical protein
VLARPTVLAPMPFDRGAVPAAAVSASLAVAAGAHLAAFPGHRGEGVAVGGVFLVVGIVQLVAAFIPRSPRVRVGIVAGNLALLVLWAVSRTVGLPFGAHAGTAEALGVLDITAAVAQATTVAIVLMLPRRCRRRLGAASALCVVALAGAVAVAGALALPVPHGTDHHGGPTDVHPTGGHGHHDDAPH